MNVCDGDQWLVLEQNATNSYKNAMWVEIAFADLRTNLLFLSNIDQSFDDWLQIVREHCSIFAVVSLW